MLTWEEIEQFLQDELDSVASFPRYLGEIAPQDIHMQLADRVEEARRADGMSPAAAKYIGAGFLLGFHIGYMLARKGYKHES